MYLASLKVRRQLLWGCLAVIYRSHRPAEGYTGPWRHPKVTILVSPNLPDPFSGFEKQLWKQQVDSSVSQSVCEP